MRPSNGGSSIVTPSDNTILQAIPPVRVIRQARRNFIQSSEPTGGNYSDRPAVRCRHPAEKSIGLHRQGDGEVLLIVPLGRVHHPHPRRMTLRRYLIATGFQ